MGVGTKQGIRMWDVVHCKLLENTNPVSAKVWMLTFKYTHAYVVGRQEDWDGVKVCDMANCVLI